MWSSELCLFHQSITNNNQSTISLLIFVPAVNLGCQHNYQERTTYAEDLDPLGGCLEQRYCSNTSIEDKLLGLHICWTCLLCAWCHRHGQDQLLSWQNWFEMYNLSRYLHYTSYLLGCLDVKGQKTACWLLNMWWVMDLPLGIVLPPPSSPIASVSTRRSSLPNSGPKHLFWQPNRPPSPFLLDLIHKPVLKRVPNTPRINGLLWYGAQMASIRWYKSLSERGYRILSCGVLVLVTVTTDWIGQLVVVGGHCEHTRAWCIPL